MARTSAVLATSQTDPDPPAPPRPEVAALGPGLSAAGWALVRAAGLGEIPGAVAELAGALAMPAGLAVVATLAEAPPGATVAALAGASDSDGGPEAGRLRPARAGHRQDQRPAGSGPSANRRPWWIARMGMATSALPAPRRDAIRASGHTAAGRQAARQFLDPRGPVLATAGRLAGVVRRLARPRSRPRCARIGGAASSDAPRPHSTRGLVGRVTPAFDARPRRTRRRHASSTRSRPKAHHLTGHDRPARDDRPS